MGKQAVVAAVNQLIYAPNYASLINEMTRIIESWAAHPMVYGGKLAYLNVLIDVGLLDRAAFERLIKLIEDQRKLVPAVKRVDYQRNLMAERRGRERKALELHELNYGPIRGARRMQFLSDLRDRWAQARAAFIRARGELDWKGRNAAANEFWEEIDRNLELNIREARKLRA
jgi:hypothetical protein